MQGWLCRGGLRGAIAFPAPSGQLGAGHWALASGQGSEEDLPLAIWHDADPRALQCCAERCRGWVFGDEGCLPLTVPQRGQFLWGRGSKSDLLPVGMLWMRGAVIWRATGS